MEYYFLLIDLYICSFVLLEDGLLVNSIFSCSFEYFLVSNRFEEGLKYALNEPFL